MRVGHEDYERADKLGTLTMERRQIVAEEFAACRIAALEEAAKVADNRSHDHLAGSTDADLALHRDAAAMATAIRKLKGDTDV